jgi:hypothetical protein
MLVKNFWIFELPLAGKVVSWRDFGRNSEISRPKGRWVCGYGVSSTAPYLALRGWGVLATRLRIWGRPQNHQISS